MCLEAEAANANLFVSAENSQFNNYFAGPQVIEVVVIDSNIDETDEGKGEPDVTVNDKELKMVQAVDGNWYGYFADLTHAKRAHLLGTPSTDGTRGSGLNFGYLVENASRATELLSDGTANGANNEIVIPESTMGVFLQSMNGATDLGFNVIREAKTINKGGGVNNVAPGQIGVDREDWPFIQLYTFTTGGNVKVQYNKGGGAQTTLLTFDTVDGSAGIELDRRTYPQNAQVHVTVTDAWLNIDPTDADSWTWYTNGTLADNAYYQIFDDSGEVQGLQTGTGQPTMRPVNSSVSLMQEDAVFKLNVRTQGSTDVIKLQDNDDTVYDAIHQHNLVKPVTLTEQGPNSGVFGTYDESDKSILMITDNADRGTSATVDYNNDPKSVLVGHNTATIEIQPSNDDWSSGEEIPVVLVDADANKNSRADEDLTVDDPNVKLIPSLVTGDPFTLGEGGMPTVAFFTETNSAMPRDIINTTSISVDTHTKTSENAVPVEIQQFSDRAMVKTGMTTTTQFDGMLIDLGTDMGDLRDTIRNSTNQSPWDTDFKGFNLLNYDLRSLKSDDTNLGEIEISVVVNRTRTLDTSVADSTVYEFQKISVSNSTNLQDLVLIDNSPDLFDTDVFADNDPIMIAYQWNDGTEIGTDTYPIVTDFFSFGFTDDGNQASERVSNQIIRLELEEDADNSSKFIGTLEYTMINQLNILEPDTYDGLATISDEASFIVFEDLTDEDAPRVNYFDLGSDGVPTPIADQEEAPSHSGVVTLDSNSYKVADTVTVTLSDPDLNVDSSLVDIFTVVKAPEHKADDAFDTIGKANLPTSDADGTKFSFGPLGRLLDVTFNDERWTSKNIGSVGDQCDPTKIDIIDTGLGPTKFSLVENGTASGIFTGNFQIPAVYCEGDGDVVSVTGTDIEVNYVDFRDASGEIIEVGDSAGVRANTGSVSLDRTVYPVPWGTIDQHRYDGGSVFPIHDTGVEGKVNLNEETLGEGVLTIHVRINDPDFDVSASGEDTIAQDVADGTQGPLKISVSRGSEEVVLAYAGGDSAKSGLIDVGDTAPNNARYMGPINEIAPDAGIFELDFNLLYTDGPASTSCPKTTDYTPLDTTVPLDEDREGNPVHVEASRFDASADDDESYCILQGDILTVEYTDPTDASGDPNTVTDSATFDLRNGVLQSDKSVYIIGSDMILTVIEPDWDCLLYTSPSPRD